MPDIAHPYICISAVGIVTGRKVAESQYNDTIYARDNLPVFTFVEALLHRVQPVVEWSVAGDAITDMLATKLLIERILKSLRGGTKADEFNPTGKVKPRELDPDAEKLPRQKRRKPKSHRKRRKAAAAAKEKAAKKRNRIQPAIGQLKLLE